MTACDRKERIDRHFEEELSPASERAMREHVPTCAACTEHYERWLVLAQLDPAVAGGKRRIGRGLGLHGSRAPASLGVAGATLLAAAAALFLWVRSGADAPGFTPRGGAPHRAQQPRVFVYDVRPGQPPALATGQIARGDELAFAYENGAAKSALLIFGVDEHAHVYWFYPAWLSKDESPVAVPIAHDAIRHELPEAVRQNLDGTHLAIRSVFLDSPVSVVQVEEMIRRGGDPLRPLPIPGAVEVPLSLTVGP